MTVRPARMSDIFPLAGLLVQSHQASRYAGHVGIDQAAARRLIAQFIQRHGGSHDGSSFVAVVEDGEGVICGFVAGALDRVYHVGDLLAANDVFLVAAPDAPATTALRLLAAYIQWAESVPDCAEIRLSWTDALPSGERMAALYERMGFRECGRIYERVAARAQTERDAA